MLWVVRESIMKMNGENLIMQHSTGSHLWEGNQDCSVSLFLFSLVISIIVEIMLSLSCDSIHSCSEPTRKMLRFWKRNPKISVIQNKHNVFVSSMHRPGSVQSSAFFFHREGQVGQISRYLGSLVWSRGRVSNEVLARVQTFANLRNPWRQPDIRL